MKILHNTIRTTFVISFCLLSTVSFAGKKDSLPGSSFDPLGRYAKFSNGELELISSAVHFGFTFTGTDCSIYCRLDDMASHNYLQYTLDGVYQKRIRISGNDPQPLKIAGLGKGRHNIWIFKTTEATTGPVFIQKIIASGIKPLAIQNKPLIEFIGNSITCGAASDSTETPCSAGEYHDHHNAYYAYGPRVARSLDLNYVLSSVSGIGIYRSWNSPDPSMPQVYEKTDFLVNSQRAWDFKLYNPFIVSIALGTNDFSEGDGKTSRLPFDSTVFVSGYIKFVVLVKLKYPQARIILLSSPMVNGNKGVFLQNCLTTVKMNIDNKFPSDKPVSLFFFKPMHAGGCSGHPSVEEHAVLADELAPAIKKLL